MTFLEPWLLLALPLILIPIIIHLMNQWRYQSQPWAAMMFLLQAKAMHRGMAKLRQWLILAMRTLAIAGLIFAMSRPLASGLIGRLAGGDVETTLIMLDRSPSMSQQAVTNQVTKLEAALEQLRQSLQYRRSQRWVLVDGLRPTVDVFSSLDELLKAVPKKTTSAAADWPHAFQLAIEYLRQHPSSQSDLWIASDMQRGDWRLDSSPWQALVEELQGLPGRLRIMNLAYPETAEEDLCLRLTASRLDVDEARRDVVLGLEVQPVGKQTANAPLPLEITLGDTVFTTDIELNQGRGEIEAYHIPLSGKPEPVAWGQVSLPADTNLANNTVYFAVAEPPTRQTVIVSERPAWVAPLRIATEVAPEELASNSKKIETKVTVVELEQAASIDYANASLVLWQGRLPDGDQRARLEEFLADGGCLWLFPPANLVEQAATENHRFLDIGWTGWRKFSKPAQPRAWRADHALLAASQSGQALSVGDLEIDACGLFEARATPLITLPDGSPLVSQVETDRGLLFVCSTLPIAPYSSFAQNGVVLYVAMQRSLALGNQRKDRAIAVEAQRFSPTATADPPSQSPLVSAPPPRLPTFTTPDGRPLLPPSRWQPLATTPSDPSTAAELLSGVYAAGEKLVTVHRPLSEDSAENVDEETFKKLLAGMEVYRLNEFVATQRPLQQEIWRFFLMAMIAALLLEAYLSLPRSSIKLVAMTNPAEEWAGSQRR
jgi:hypothetical protein